MQTRPVRGGDRDGSAAALIADLRAALAPDRVKSAPTELALYGRDAARWHALPGTYVRHMWRTAAPTLRVLGAGMVR